MQCLHQLRAASLSGGRLLYCLWDVTRRCPLRCRHCYLAGRAEGPELDTDEARRVLAEAAGMGALFLVLTGGEPMLRPDILAIIDSARSLGFAWKLFTSGVTLDDESAAALAEREPLGVAVSIHGLGAAHDDLTRTPGSFKAAVRAVERLRSRGARVAVKTCVTRRGLADLDGLRRLVGSLGAAHQVSPVIHPGAGGAPVPADLAVADEDLPRYYRGCPGDLPPALREAAGTAAEGFGARPVCGAGRMSLAISAGGDVRPCALVDRVCGNVRRSALREVWESPAMAYFRGITNADRRGCAGCPEIALCAYCMGLALAETGDLLGVPPTACRQARALRACMTER